MLQVAPNVSAASSLVDIALALTRGDASQAATAAAIVRDKAQPDNAAARVQLLQTGVAEALISAMAAHRNVLLVQEPACAALLSLSTANIEVANVSTTLCLE